MLHFFVYECICSYIRFTNMYMIVGRGVKHIYILYYSSSALTADRGLKFLFFTYKPKVSSFVFFILGI